MRRVLIVAAIFGVCLAGQSLAITLNQDGVLDEWVGPEINDLGALPAPEGGKYHVLATWDGANFNIAIDRSSTGRYLGDENWNNDSFFVAVDIDDLDGQGASGDGYGRVTFDGVKKPELIYYFAGNSPSYERSAWNGMEHSWLGWIHEGQYYGDAASPNDELVVPLVTDAVNECGTDISLVPELSVWIWMTREGNGFVETSWPVGSSGYIGQAFGEPIKIRKADARMAVAHDPSPALYGTDVDCDAATTLSWQVAQVPSGGSYVVDPAITDYEVYMAGPFASEPNALADLNFTSTATVNKAAWSGTEASVQVGPLDKNSIYFWRVDAVKSSATVTGDIWAFYTEISKPLITEITTPAIIEAGTTANITVTATSPLPETYQWYRVEDSGALVDGGDISGATTATLSIANAELADQGQYYCVVTNDAGSTQSANVLLAIKRLLAHWDFEGGSYASNVIDSPATKIVGDPEFVQGSIVNGGSAVYFDDETDAEDMLYTDPNFAAYFHSCNYQMTASCWVKTTTAKEWVPFVSRNGEGAGWQLRLYNTNGRPCFTTRGITGYGDGSEGDRIVNDGQWHYVVGTWDGAVKKLYIDGVLSRHYDWHTGELIEGDEVTGIISSASESVAIAGRLGTGEGGVIEPHVWDNCPGTYDDIKVYNYALDAATIAQTYADVTATSLCMTPPQYDFDGDCQVNLVDLAMFAGEWLNNGTVTP